MCSICGVPTYMPCNCPTVPNFPNMPCDDSLTCVEKVDAACVSYNLNRLTAFNKLLTLKIANNTNLQFILESIDAYLGVNKLFYSVTYLQLTTAITNSTLVKGAFYLITDFATTYEIFDFNTTTGAVTDSLTTATAPIEPIIVLATDINKLSEIAYSTIYPRHQLVYTVNNITSFLNATTKGTIIRRTDLDNDITLFCDWIGAQVRVNGTITPMLPISLGTGKVANVFIRFENPTVGTKAMPIYVGDKGLVAGSTMNNVYIESINGDNLFVKSIRNTRITGTCAMQAPNMRFDTVNTNTVNVNDLSTYTISNVEGPMNGISHTTLFSNLNANTLGNKKIWVDSTGVNTFIHTINNLGAIVATNVT